MAAVLGIVGPKAIRDSPTGLCGALRGSAAPSCGSRGSTASWSRSTYSAGSRSRGPGAKIGTTGRELVQEFATEIETSEAMEALARAKQPRGYRDLRVFLMAKVGVRDGQASARPLVARPVELAQGRSPAALIGARRGRLLAPLASHRGDGSYSISAPQGVWDRSRVRPIRLRGDGVRRGGLHRWLALRRHFGTVRPRNGSSTLRCCDGGVAIRYRRL